MQQSADPIRRLLNLMDRLREPGGCPWDRDQTLADLRGYLIEEAYEVAEAMDNLDWGHLREELGDLLFQIVFVSRIAKEEGQFLLDDVATEIHDKMVRRHPHVFGDSELDDAGAVARQWEEIKQGEDKRRDRGVLDGVPRALPALLKAYRVTEKAASLGFEWQRIEDVVGKLHEELEEWKSELLSDAPDARQRATREFGDLLFVMVNLARRLKLDPEAALQQSTEKFRRRFEGVAKELQARGRSFSESNLDEMDAIWEQIKSTE